MLRIVDYAKRCEMEWYEVMRQSINELSVTPVAILNHGELMVYELDENELMGDYPGTEPIALAYEECALNPAFMARLVHARFPSNLQSSHKNTGWICNGFLSVG